MRALLIALLLAGGSACGAAATGPQPAPVAPVATAEVAFEVRELI